MSPSLLNLKCSLNRLPQTVGWVSDYGGGFTCRGKIFAFTLSYNFELLYFHRLAWYFFFPSINCVLYERLSYCRPSSISCQALQQRNQYGPHGARHSSAVHLQCLSDTQWYIKKTIHSSFYSWWAHCGVCLSGWLLSFRTIFVVFRSSLTLSHLINYWTF